MNRFLIDLFYLIYYNNFSHSKDHIHDNCLIAFLYIMILIIIIFNSNLLIVLIYLIFNLVIFLILTYFLKNKYNLIILFLCELKVNQLDLYNLPNHYFNQ